MAKTLEAHDKLIRDIFERSYQNDGNAEKLAAAQMLTIFKSKRG